MRRAHRRARSTTTCRSARPVRGGAARRIRADEIDILVDLNGLTRGARLGALRWKPAPVQATYLGYVGPVPMPELDWLICDDDRGPARPGAALRAAAAAARRPLPGQ